eukprot:TRINITY_DN50431_c0_g1_i1.p1 TRINITY_DN50431_c0_g1~~TRINITY_DN50431_c0_g1_i1.p1  ORF type:complete len:314 (-),score=54.33 TRINITY_DN50431_c0_g1_i1:161-1102(-)
MARPLRLLCLHGYGQNAEVFRQRTGALRRALKAHVKDFVFVDAPLACTHFLGEEPRPETGSTDAAVAPTPQRLGWYDWKDMPDGQRLRFGWEKSEAALLNLVDNEDPSLDGILGFSQGAVAGALLCVKRPGRFRVAILVAGGMPTDPHMRDMLVSASASASGEDAHSARATSSLTAEEVQSDCRPNLPPPPSMHVYGEGDKLIEPQRVLELAELWARSAVALPFSHPGGHMIPSSKEFRSAVVAFLQKSLDHVRIDDKPSVVAAVELVANGASAAAPSPPRQPKPSVQVVGLDDDELRSGIEAKMRKVAADTR